VEIATVENGEKTAGQLAVLRVVERPWPSISAENKRLLADNSWRKQQKLREKRLNTIARYLSATRVAAAHARGGPT
jgi:hypothetical protein